MDGRGETLRRALFIVEVTTAVVLWIASGLLIRFPRYAPAEERNAFHSRVLDEVRALLLVANAAYTSFLPIRMGGGIWPVEIDGQQRSRSDSETASLRFITSAYFATLRIRIRQGRDVSESDTREQPFDAGVSESFVERYWPGLDPLGRTFTFAFAARTGE